MATFHVGQRVRVIGGSVSCLGKTATIIGPLGMSRFAAGYSALSHDVDIDGQGPLNTQGLRLSFEPHELAPLTDPLADAFVERIKRIAREPAPMVKEPTHG